MRDDWKNALLADTAVLFAAASTRGLVSVVSVLSSLYPVVVAVARTLAERIARAQQAGVVLALGRRRADQSGIGQGPFRPGRHFGNVAYASFGDVVSSSTPAPCRRASSERG
jgi:hypothetical protein